MQVSLIPSSEVNSDLGVVNVARVSLDRKSEYEHIDDENGSFYVSSNDPLGQRKKIKRLSEPDAKLIHYLAKNNHWTPFAHSRLYFGLKFKDQTDALHFLLHYNPGGFTHSLIEGNSMVYFKGSLYSWVNNAQYLGSTQEDAILDEVVKRYPITAGAFMLEERYPSFAYDHGVESFEEDYVLSKKQYNLACATLLLKVPIFVARQIRTSMVGLAYSDYYIESESFTFNEVSRRYVNTEPEFWSPETWRVRIGNKIKQGSTGLSGRKENEILTKQYKNVLDMTKKKYNHFENIFSVAPEQARALLPQSMYTQFWMTGTLHRWAQFLNLRLDKHVQEETRYIASRILDVLKENFPKWVEHYWHNGWVESYLET